MICIIDFGSRKTPEIALTLTKLGFVSYVVQWNEIENVQLENSEAIILSGAPVLFTETDIKVYTDRFAFLKDVKIPVLGICFGHQLLGLLFGAEVFKSDAVRTETEIMILSENKLFEGFAKTVVMREDHTEGITLPDSFIKLASSDKYEVEAMKHNTSDLYGVQFHPEVSGENGLKLLTNFCKLI